MKKYLMALAIACSMQFCLYPLMCFCESSPVRVKDIAHVLEAKDNQVMGFGLVIGLKNTGDSTQTEFTKQALTNMLSKMGIAQFDKEFKSKNVAAVIVTAKFPAYVNVGQKIDVTVSSLGDATSLQGGTLLMTPLQGADDNIYAVAQGPISLGLTGSDAQSPNIERKQTNVGKVVNGAIVEKEVPVSIGEDAVSIVLENPDFTTAYRVVIAMKEAGIQARARDAATIIASKEVEWDMVEFVSRIENLSVIPDTVARIVINERSGVIVFGENVVISPVALSYGDVNVSISSQATISELVSALNSAGIRPKDLVSIIQSIKSAGAISADIEVI